MIKSMTGYGRGEALRHGRDIVAEVRAVNNRYLDCTVKIPRAYIFAEDALKKEVQAQVGRGKVDVFFTIQEETGQGLRVKADMGLAKSYLDALRMMAGELGLGSAVASEDEEDLLEQLKLVARFPDVLTVEKPEEDLEEVKADLLEVLDLALADFNAMRTKEGEKLRTDILSRAQTIEELVGQVERQSPETVKAYRQRLEAKLQEVLENRQLDESRILTEAAIFADKIAVDEETVRLRSHIAQLRELLDKGGDEKGGGVGRKLDFLIQEFNREANTTGSKCTDLNVTRMVVDMKAEIEKIREQVQNIE